MALSCTAMDAASQCTTWAVSPTNDSAALYTITSGKRGTVEKAIGTSSCHSPGPCSETIDRMSKRWRILRRMRFALAFLLIVTIATDAAAQGRVGAVIAGRVVDSSGAFVTGVTLSASAPELIGGVRTIISEADGHYRFTGLPPGTYRIEAAHPGFKTVVVQDVVLTADATAVIDLALEVSRLAERIVVNGAPPVDVRSATTSWGLDRSLLRDLPTGRSLSSLLSLAPGVTEAAAFGSARLANEVRLAGVNLSNTWALQPWVATDYNWISSVRVVGLGASAEYGGFGGALLDAQLEAGGNQVRALGEFRFSRPSWMNSNVSSLNADSTTVQNPPQQLLHLHDVSVTGGGPLRVDRLWLFVGYEGSRNHYKPALYTGEDAVDVTDRRAVVRVDGSASRTVAGGMSYTYARSKGAGVGLGPFTPIEATWLDTQRDRTGRAFATMTRDGSVVEISGSVVRSVLSSDPMPPGTRSGPYPRFDVVLGQASGNAGNYSDLASNRAAASVVFRSVRRRWLSVATGADIQRAGQQVLQGYPGGRSYRDRNGVPATVFLRDPDRTDSDMTRLAMFGSVDLLTKGRLTVSPGIRLTVDRGSMHQGPSLVRTTSIDPRVGIAWDVSSDHTTVVRSHFGRYHDPLVTNQFSYLDPEFSTEVMADVVGPDQFVEVSRTTPTQFAIDPAIRLAFFDQFVIGAERQFSSIGSGSVHYIRRRYSDITAFVDRGSIYQPISVLDPGPDGIRLTPDDGQSVELFLKTNPGNERYYYTNPPDAYRTYDAVQFSASTRQFGGLRWQGSYVWSRTRGNVENGDFSNSTGPDVGTNGTFSDPNRAIFAEGPTTFEFPHEAKALVAYRLPKIGMMVSGIYRYHSGVGWGRTVQFREIQFVTFGVRVEPRDTNRTPALNSVDLRLEKLFGFRRGSVGMYADVFNATNQGAPDPAFRRPVINFSGPSFGKPQFWLAPRRLQVGLRVSL